jgi:cytochrome P450
MSVHVQNTADNIEDSGVTRDRAIPIAKGLPLIGSIFRLMRSPLEGFLSMTRECGPVFYFKAFNQKMLVMAGTDVNRFLSEEGKDCIISAEYWKDLVSYWECPHVLIALDGQPHIDERRLWKRYISRDVANSEQTQMFNVLRDCTDLYAHGNVVSVRQFSRTLVTRELSFLFTGEIFHLPPELAQSLVEYMRTLLSVKAMKAWPGFIMRLPFFRKHERNVKAFAAELLVRARTHLDEDSLFSMVIKRVDADAARNEAELVPILLLPFIAGLDTLANAMTFLFSELLADPALLARVRADVDRACEANGGALPPPEQMRHIPALFGVCEETLRRHPIAFASMRHAAKDFNYDGYHVSAGQQIIFFTSSAHFDPAIFREPYKFDIDRFLEPRVEQRTRYAFSPYGRGPHICLGAAMAESIFLSTVACLLRYYDFSAAVPGKRYKTIYEPGPSLPDKFGMRVTKRQQK